MFSFKKKVLFGLSVSLVLAMAVGSFALGEAQTPVTPHEVEVHNAAGETFGPFTVDGGTQGADFDYTSPVLTIHSGNLTVSTNTQTTERIVVDGAATINLAGVNIDRTNETEATAPITIADDVTFDVNILLADESNNILKGIAGSGFYNPGSPGIQKNGDTGVGTLTITGSAGEDAGILNATGGWASAGIGGGQSGSVRNITISGGNITATGGFEGAGIGGGQSGNGNEITISGGTVIANGGIYAAGIGGGNEAAGGNGNGTKITISGGTVTATGGGSGAGIGGGNNGSGTDIKISGGKVKAYSGDCERGMDSTIFGAGIGGGCMGDGTDITISGGVVIAVGKNAGAGIGGGAAGNGTGITISGGSITATGGYYEVDGQKHSGAGIGGGATKTGSNNKLNGNAVVFAISGEDDSATGGVKPQLDGFADSDMTGGIAFTGVGEYEFVPSPDAVDPNDGDWLLKNTTWNEGTQYGNVTATEDTTFPADFTITSNAALTIGKNADGKEATISMEEGKKLTVEGSLINKGVIDIPAENIECSGNGIITTLLNYDPQGGTIKTNDDNYITYQDVNGTKKYENLPEAIKEGYDLEGWYTKEKGQGTKIETTDDVLLNQHTLYANWVESEPPTPTPPTPTPPGPEPQPTPPGPQPGPEPEPTPEPTPDPSVNPDDGGSGSGSSSKTSDPFMGGVALALLGVATTGAVLVRKRK